MPRTGASNKSPPNETARSRAGDRWSAAGAARLSWCGSSAAAWQLSFGTPQRIMSAGLLAKADRLRLRTARAPCQALCQRPAASSQGTRPGARSCWRLPLFQPPVVAPQPPTGPVERSLKRQHTSVSRRGAVGWSLAAASKPLSARQPRSRIARRSSTRGECGAACCRAFSWAARWLRGGFGVAKHPSRAHFPGANTSWASAPRPPRSPKATPQEFCTSAERFADWQCLAKHGRGGECPLST